MTAFWRKFLQLGLITSPLFSTGFSAEIDENKCRTYYVTLVSSPEEVETFVNPPGVANLRPMIRRELTVRPIFQPPERLLREAASSPDLWRISLKDREGRMRQGTVSRTETVKQKRETALLAITIAPEGGGEPVRVLTSDIDSHSLRISPKPLAIPLKFAQLPSRSAFADAASVPYLSHYSKRGDLPEILRSGSMARQRTEDENGNEVNMGYRSAVYFRPLNHHEVGKKLSKADAGHNRPQLLFSNRILDRNDYYLNVDVDDHGARTDASTACTDKDGVQELLWMVGGNTSKRDLDVEMVTLGPVSLEHLKAILVPPRQKKRYVQELRAAGIVQFQGRPIEDLILEGNSWPEPSQLR